MSEIFNLSSVHVSDEWVSMYDCICVKYNYIMYVVLHFEVCVWRFSVCDWLGVL